MLSICKTEDITHGADILLSIFTGSLYYKYLRIQVGKERTDWLFVTVFVFIVQTKCTNRGNISCSSNSCVSKSVLW